MTKFRLGDPVRIIARGSRYFDAVGTVVDIDSGQYFPFHVAGLTYCPLTFDPAELVLAECPTATNERREP